MDVSCVKVSSIRPMLLYLFTGFETTTADVSIKVVLKPQSVLSFLLVLIVK